MAIKFFGHYLLDNNVLTAQQLTQAVEYQSLKNLTLGELAVREQLITMKDAQKINDKQRSLDKRFGEVSIALELLDEVQITMLLKIQKEEKVFFGEVLLLKEFINQETLDKELSTFEELQKIETVELDDTIEALDKDNIIKETIGVFQKLYSRIVHDHIKLIEINTTSNNASGIIALQKMRGDIHLNFAIQPEDTVALAISQKFLKTDFEKIDEMVIDIISEFVNVVLGNITVKLSKDGVRLDLTPPISIDSEDFKREEYISFLFSTTQGNLYLYLKV
ncbi:chemotaxis protein CheX [Sulfurimonas sp. SAG-AH-194-C21]|nr:chemotaxis protein CheX [Sulfurimonas sp. SAG-AH-194-C21]MDF1884054.1 chemotaxis protein CheX [Sulfurimonas sp. SAG-AH-194-C21]